ncbi:MAG TPA: hypothetical protein VJG32_17665 [Anaerolineae bacterium]|nr:hypothetical protein [Anaerolineae bacterium]
MSQTTSSSPADRRLRILRFGLTLLPVLAFAIATGLWAVGSLGTDLGGAVLQGAIWGVGAAIVSIIIYVVYKSMVVKA